MSFSIIIPCKNESQYIAQTLQSIVLQTVVDLSIPIIIADAHSTDGTREVIQTFAKQHGLNVQIIDGGLPPVGRNKGAAMADTPYLLFLDADIELGETHTLEKVMQRAQADDLEMVVTHIQCKDANWLDVLLWRAFSLAARMKLKGGVATGMFIFIKKTAFDRIGGFNEQMSLGDDVEIARQISRQRFAIANTFIWTTNRRFKKDGYLRTFSRYLRVFFSKRYRQKNLTTYFDEPPTEVGSEKVVILPKRQKDSGFNFFRQNNLPL